MDRNIEYEVSILAGMLNDKNCLEDGLRLTGYDFTNDEYRNIFELIKRMATDGKDINIMTVFQESGGLLDMARLGEIQGQLYYESSFKETIAELQDLTLKRSLRETARKILESEASGTDLASEVERQVVGIRDDVSSGEFSNANDLAMRTFDILEMVQSGKMEKALPTGFHALDKALGGGLRKQELIILGARPSMGKTALMLNIVEQITRKDKVAAIFSYEMGEVQLMQRMISSLAMVNTRDDIQGQEWEKVIGAIGNLSNRKLYVTDDPRIKIPDMLSMCRKIQRREGLDVVVVDYMQIIPSHVKGDSRTKLEAVSKDLKAMSKILDVPVVVISSLSRGVEQRDNKRPIMSDLRESGQIEFDADVIMFLYRDEYYHEDTEKPNTGEVIIAKNRNGALGVVELHWEGQYTSFFNRESERNY